jgi:small subunit ribosomal protein S4e
MRRHQKREQTPKNWPIPRKGTAFVVKGNAKGVPVLVALRDMLNLAQNRNEVKKAIHKRALVISGKKVHDEKKIIYLYDILSILPSKKDYQLVLNDKGKFIFTQVSKEKTNEKISKIISKKRLKGNKIQVNLLDGRNYFCDIKCSLNDSVLISLDKKKITKILPMKKGAEVLVIGGKHSGKIGKILSLDEKEKIVEIESKEGKFNILIKHLMVTN